MSHSVFGVTAMVAVACLPASAQEQQVTPKEIQETWVAKALIGTTANGAPATLRLQPDGTASVAAGSTTDSGTWRLSDQGYCTTWKNIRAGQERCFTVRRLGNKMTVLNPDGSINGQFTEAGAPAR